MREITEIELLVKKHLLETVAPSDADREARALADALATMRRVKPHPVPLSREIGGTIVRSRIARLAAGVAAVVVMVSIAGRFSRPVWALDQVIAAMQKHKACNLTMIDSAGVVYDLWAKAEPSGELSDEVTLRGTNGTVIWVKVGKTYYYDPKANTVEVDDAKTAGFSPWLGPELMRMIAKADDAQTRYGKDPTTNRDLVVMTGSMTTVAGRISWSVEFDRETKLPVALKQWGNPRKSGAPSLSIVRIVYYQDVPRGFLTVDVPENATFRQKPIILPEENLALLGNPNHGIATDGLTRTQASRRILEEVYRASIAGDPSAIRRLCPLTAAWSDELLRAVILNEDESKRLAEVVEIKPISREGYNRLGPFVVVPVRLKTRDGRLWDEKQIVQFRQIDGHDSCVVYGPYGMISEVK